MLPEASTSPEELGPPASPEVGHIMKVLEGRPVEISPAVLNMLPDPMSKAAMAVDSYWIEGWTKYSNQSSSSIKLSAAKAMAVLSLVLIEEPKVEVLDMKLTKKSSETALWNTDKIIRDRDHFKEQVTWLQGGGAHKEGFGGEASSNLPSSVEYASRSNVQSCHGC
ncbi:Uncharacterized protein Fot_35966 [Forsythia ovata]|uniref:Uncharacterized protein n=1 Tax=Forsythia ovata TaxID=205694 RepID=A0ABD1SQV9_9LAMI